jgi:hypothetical protein
MIEMGSFKVGTFKLRNQVSIPLRQGKRNGAFDLVQGLHFSRDVRDVRSDQLGKCETLSFAFGLWPWESA